MLSVVCRLSSVTLVYCDKMTESIGSRGFTEKYNFKLKLSALLRKKQKTLGGYFILTHPVDKCRLFGQVSVTTKLKDGNFEWGLKLEWVDFSLLWVAISCKPCNTKPMSQLIIIENPIMGFRFVQTWMTLHELKRLNRTYMQSLVTKK